MLIIRTLELRPPYAFANYASPNQFLSGNAR